MAKLVSATYGDALFSLACEENKVDSLYEEVKSLQKILEQNPDFSVLMNHPKVTKEEKEKTLEEVFGGRADAELVGFLKLLLRKDRYSELPAILAHFTAQVKEYRGIGVANITSPLELTDKQKKEIEAKLLATTKYKTMEMHYSVDKSLIGGLVIRIGDRVVDSSIRTKLEGLKRELGKIQIA
ncbi:MAG: F0F1 ATP synthase subunit delta [Lachnospiraceae bacterium]|nr:F0F1 ATP synthase subunit delta [Lachnospiraceae bacterium]